MRCVNPDDVRRWVENFRCASEREMAELRRNPRTPQEAIAAAMALLRYDETLHGNPFERDDPVSRREDEELWESWAKLRARWSNDR